MTPSSLNNLTDAEKRVRIAEACGWRLDAKGGWNKWTHPTLTGGLPDYLNDLNAMAEAERNAPCALYCDTLRKVLSRHINCHPSQVVESRMVMATAAQRAEAFLATIAP